MADPPTRRLAAVFAHRDDDTFGIAGIAAVRVLCDPFEGLDAVPSGTGGR